MDPHPRQTALASPVRAPGGFVSIPSPLGRLSPSSCAFGVLYGAAVPVPRLGAPTMAEPDYDFDQFPTIDAAHRSPQGEYARPQRVADWESIKSGSLSVLPTQDNPEAA